jgi:uncharacterized protein
METQDTYTTFHHQTKIAHGTLETVLIKTKAHMESNSNHDLLIFHDQSGKQIDFDFRGTDAEILARVLPPMQTGRGRPKLGVTSREVTLLPRHWEWLEAQPSGASATLRRLIEAEKNSSQEQERQRIEAVGRFMSAMAGNAAHFEEASRALYAKDFVRLSALINDWQPDVRSYIIKRLKMI